MFLKVWPILRLGRERDGHRWQLRSHFGTKGIFYPRLRICKRFALYHFTGAFQREG
jgi:hypothetical protein